MGRGFAPRSPRSSPTSSGSSRRRSRSCTAKPIKLASHLLEAAPDDIVLEGGSAKVAGTDRELPIASLARAAYHQSHRFNGEIEPGIMEAAIYDPPGTFSNACHAAI